MATPEGMGVELQGEPGGAPGAAQVGGGADDAQRRGTRLPSRGRARATQRTPASPAAAGSAQQVPVPPNSPGGGEPADAFRERLDALTGRLVSVETSVQSLQRGAQATLAELLSQARAEFATQRDSLVALRSEVQQEAGTLRAYLEETRLATEHVYAGACLLYTSPSPRD